MRPPGVHPTGVERYFGEEDIIVTKTDLRGVVTYANEVFLDIAGYTEEEVLGEAHNIVRHPDMPRCVFHLLWETIKSGKEIFAYVMNMAKNGDHYWVFAHVTPTFDSEGNITGYHSNRRFPDASAVEKVKPLYKLLLEEENRHADWRDGMTAAGNLLGNLLRERNMEYDEFVFSL